MKAVTLCAALAALILTGCTASAQQSAPAPASAPVTKAKSALDDLAGWYVVLSLQIGAHEPGYIDAYYGPAVLKQRAEAEPKTKAELRPLVGWLRASLAEERLKASGLDLRRIAFLDKQLIAADTRLAMMEGEKLTFANEAERLFGVRPVLKPLSAYDAGLAEIAKLVRGDGPLAAQVDAYLDRFTIPKDRLLPVFNAAIATCRARSEKRIAMPPGEAFKLEFVTGKSWSGYNYYQGNFQSLIQINTDFPIRLSRAVDLGCHEGYPGHHALNALLEARLTRARDWVEYSVYPLYSPQSLIAEGTANYGIEMAFPGRFKQIYEREILMPMAGIGAPADDSYWRLTDAIKAVSGARLTIAQMYLDGEIDRARAVELTQQYLLMSPARAEQSVKFTETYRSYVINYGLGEAMVKADVEREKGDAARWRRFEALISEPTLPGDLQE